MRLKILSLLSLMHLTACTSNESIFSDKVSVDPISGQDGTSPPFLQEAGASWFSCNLSPKAGFAVLINPGPAAWTADDACKNPAASAFLSHGLNVLSVNRPAQEILGDDASLGQMKETLDQLQKDRRLESLWSMGEGSVLTLRLARLYPWQVLIIGNGIYDWEQTLKESTDQEFLARIKALPGSNEAIFAEKRSASWDLSGLPKVIYLYHGGKNSQVSSGQATQFRNSLSASEHKAELYILDEDGQVMRPEYHRGVLRKILDTLQKPQ